MSNVLDCLTGMVAQEVQQLLKNGVKTHFGDLYNVVDFCMLEAYIGALFLFHMTMFKVRSRQLRVCIAVKVRSRQLSVHNCQGQVTAVESVHSGQGQVTAYLDRTHWSDVSAVNLR